MTKLYETEDTRKPSIREALKAQVQAKLAAAVEKKATQLELTQALPPDEWEVFAWGPYQFNGGFDPSVNPGRIIFTDEKAYIAVAVWMNPHMCRVVTDHQDKIMLNVWTSDMQRMEPVDDLSFSCCITTVQGGPCYYVTVFEFTPTEEACIYETNICARICNCNGNTLRDYAGFVRHVFDFDPEHLWPGFPVTDLPAPPMPSPTPSWGFDRPIRFMVADPQKKCECEPGDECGPADPLPVP